MKVKRLDHLVVSAADGDAAAAAWREAFGLETDETVSPVAFSAALCLLPLADCQDGGAFLEIAQPLSEDNRIAQVIAERGEGMFSLSFEVDDLDAAVAELRAAGVTVDDPGDGLLPGTRVARFDPGETNGVSLQLIERA